MTTGTLLSLSLIAHVLSAAFWTGAILFFAYAVLPAGEAFDRPALNVLLDRLLRVTRWTGVVLPITGAYQLWVLYPLSPGALLSSWRGQLVVAMLALWGLLNGLLELACYRMRTVEGPVAPGPYLREGFLVDGGVTEASAAEIRAVGRPYVLASVVLSVVLLADAALLAS